MRVCVRVCVCVRARARVCVHVFVRLCACVWVGVHMRARVHERVCMCVCVGVRACTCVHVHARACVVCACVQCTHLNEVRFGASTGVRIDTEHRHDHVCPSQPAHRTRAEAVCWGYGARGARAVCGGRNDTTFPILNWFVSCCVVLCCVILSA